MIFCAHAEEGMGSDAWECNVRQVKTRIPGEATYPEAIIGIQRECSARSARSLNYLYNSYYGNSHVIKDINSLLNFLGI